MPGVYNLSVDNLLPADFFLIGYGRKAMEDEAFSESARASLRRFSRRSLDDEIWARLREKTSYFSGLYDSEEDFARLTEKIDGIVERLGREVQLLFYVSTPPSVFKPILENLGKCGLARRHLRSELASKVIIEKPFGKDLQSARELNRVIEREFDESQVFRIDHYLGKETVQDLLVQRFANSIFEPIWNREYVECVQITVAEEIGVEGRGGYYDQSGALRDMVQNHTMQLLALTAMEPPVSLDPEAIRDEKVKVLKAIQAPELRVDEGGAVRARYNEGIIGGEKVSGYLDEEGISTDSTAETYAALCLSLKNWRWQGVPFYVRSGKRMAQRVSEITVQFKRPPGVLFTQDVKYDVAPNLMIIRIQPDEGITLWMNSKVPGLEARTQPVKLHFRYSTTYGSNTPEAYERLLLDAMVNDSTLFIRGDETEASWKLMTPILDFWDECGTRGLETYTAGSWGPQAAERLLWKKGHSWH